MNKNLNEAEGAGIFDPNQMPSHNRSYNPEFIKRHDDDVDITDAHISLNHK